MGENSFLKSRISQYLDFTAITKYECYQKTGIANGVLSQKGGLSEDNLMRFLSYYDELNAEWLLTGEGEMIKPTPILYKDEQNKELLALRSDDYKGIPLIPLDAMAGFVSGDGSGVMEYECEHYIIPNFRDADFLIAVKGESMSPKYISGDIVACKKLPIDTFFQWNKVYVLDTDQGALIKRIKKSNSTDYIMCVSENTDYDPFELHKEHIYSLAIVVGLIRTE